MPTNKEEEIMTTKTENPTSWAEARGRLAAERRAAQEAQQRAEAAADGERRDVPVTVLEQRFADTGALVFDLVDAHARAAGIDVVADGVLPPRLDLRAPSGRVDRLDDRLILAREDALLRATLIGASRMEQVLIDLDDPTFEAESAARRIATHWFAQLELREGGPHVTR
jgi:hypothetical protein